MQLPDGDVRSVLDLIPFLVKSNVGGVSVMLFCGWCSGFSLEADDVSYAAKEVSC